MKKQTHAINTPYQHPVSTIFGNFNERQREKMDVLDTTIRLSIGLEAPEDLIEDISMGIRNSFANESRAKLA